MSYATLLREVGKDPELYLIREIRRKRHFVELANITRWSVRIEGFFFQVGVQILVALVCKIKNNISRDQGKTIGWRNGSIKLDK